MNHKIGIWIDHNAVVLSASASGVTAKTLNLRSDRIPVIQARRTPIQGAV
jgi:hypothetical protein